MFECGKKNKLPICCFQGSSY